ncbi:LytS/YhcK type 5TM receptor domain-containing protein [Desulfosporosinus lacus]|uniref:Two-component system, LytT family, sensor histidine kinase LytS n=1 Tax=Desulfosporosinus lacus DSM 15449 TaxID=1121420 RepID=A0A1M5RKU6_9FIRM|nr:LytS/YhcK type 5TM receptor domain-containing protein [Desulfosporosinus lacus]SHH26810.1 two-component system, LytT family, sensor histidine kinase LytS [Desulfosporosinus lacus DSM 15449]
MSNSLLWNLTLNIGLLVLIANLLTKNKIVRRMLLEKSGNLWSQATLAVFFGLFCILSTYTGVQLEGVIVNTRVIGALAGGILGGPVVGIGAGLIGGVHRYFYDIDRFTSVACAVSTLFAGIIGAVFYPHFQRGKWNQAGLFAITIISEVVQMAMILLLCRPFDMALSVVKTIALPMIFLNSFGMVIFMATFKNVFIEKDQESASKMSLALSIAERCLPYLRNGLSSREDLKSAVSIILSSAICSIVIITDRQQILARGQTDSNLDIDDFKELPLPAKQAMEDNQFVTLTETKNNTSLKGILRHHTIIAAPLTKMDHPVGCLMVFVKRRWLNLEADISFVKGLATLFSTQLELSDIDYQKHLRQRAEFSALQSQINPHFLYNSLNTVSCICRENPAQARELLMALATYFRQTLDSDRCMITLKEEMAHVNNYLILEKARFEEKLDVTIDVPEHLDCLVPALILQPIVENAVKYGADSYGRRRIRIVAREISDSVSIIVSDCGSGFPPDVLEDLHNGASSGNHIGLSNVQKRLKSIYGEENSLRITCIPEGSQVEFMITDAKEDTYNTDRKEPAQ